MRIRKGWTVGACALAAAALGPVATSSATPPSSRVVGHAYVNDNPAGPNAIAAFDRHADGSLTPAAGSPFTTGGQGAGHGLGSQGAIQEAYDGRFVLAVNAGSNSVSVLRELGDGALRRVGDPVPSGGLQPVSIAVHGSLVYVANGGDGGVNYTGFRLSPDGALRAIAGSTYALPDGTGPGDVLFNRSGDRLVGTRDTTSLIDSFRVRFDGRLVPAAGSPFAAQAAGPIGAEFRPTSDSQLYVSNAHAGAGNGTVSAFDVNPFGNLTPIGSSPFADFQTAPCWVEITHDGRYLFAVNTASANISTYAIQRDGSLALQGTTAFTNGTGAVDARLAPDGRTLLVTGGRGQVLSSFAVDGGRLTEFASSPSPLPANTSPTGLVVN